MIYPETRADYFPKAWDSAEYEAQFKLFFEDKGYIGFTEHGFIRLNLLQKIGQIFKGLLGGTNSTAEHRVQAAWLRFFYYGEAQGFLRRDQVEQLNRRIQYHPQDVSPALKKLFTQISHRHLNWKNAKESQHLKDLRTIVTQYHQHYAASLRPGFWICLFTHPYLDNKKLFDFGDTHRLLSQRALEPATLDANLALTHLRKAFVIKNDSSTFQQKLAHQLENLENAYSSQLQHQQANIQELWIGLAKTAFENGQQAQANTYLEKALKAHPSYVQGRLEIGKLYLLNKQYGLVQPFLAELQKTYSKDFLLLVEIGNAYWEATKYQEAVVAYEMALNDDQKTSSADKHKAFLYHRLGTAQWKNFIPHIPQKIIEFLSEAVKLDSTVLQYKEDLCNAYIQQWKTDPVNFAASFGKDWINSLSFYSSTMFHAKASDIKKMLLSCSEQFFQIHQNKEAHTYLAKALEFFPNQADLKIEVLDVAIRYQDWQPLEKYFPAWEKENYANPYLKKKIAETYWDKDKTTAIGLYQTALALFKQRLPLCQGADQITCQRHIAEIQLKIGQNHLKTPSGLFKGVSYDKALQRLEEAAGLNDDYKPDLFDAYIAAAEAEKQKFLRDTAKIMTYYQKAFETLLKKGVYLIELLQLYLDAKRYSDAIKLYQDVQKQTWAQDFVLPAKLFNRLAEQLFAQKDYENALICLRQAHLQDPNNTSYKHDYFQLALTLAQNHYQKIQNNKAEKENIRIQTLLKSVQILTECWKVDFQDVEQFKSDYEETLAKIYGSLAECYVQRCWLPLPASEYSKDEIKKHRMQHQQDVQQAVDYYSEALHYQPNNAALYFDKGLILDWNTQYPEALQEIELAVKHQPRNPFYHKILATLQFAVKAYSVDEQMELARKCAPDHFEEDYPIWQDEYMSTKKTKVINPHFYTTKASFFDFFS